MCHNKTIALYTVAKNCLERLKVLYRFALLYRKRLKAHKKNEQAALKIATCSSNLLYAYNFFAREEKA